jgi:serine O-acetyltransferase
MEKAEKPPTVWQLIRSDYLRVAPVFSYRGLLRLYLFDETFALVFWYRMARSLTQYGWTNPLLVLSYLMLRRQNRKTGVRLSRHATIGPAFRIEHAGTTYINADTRIGANCTLMHNLTIGVSHSPKGKPGVPTIGDRVFIGPNCVLYGGITVGNDVMIGANSVVNRDVENGVLVAGAPATVRGRCISGPRSS